MQLERLLPVVQAMLRLLGGEAFEFVLHVLGKFFQAFNVTQHPSFPRSQGHAQDAGGAGVGGLDDTVCVHHDHACGEVIQNSLQIRPRGVHLHHAAIERLARVGELLRHVGKRARQAL